MSGREWSDWSIPLFLQGIINTHMCSVNNQNSVEYYYMYKFVTNGSSFFNSKLTYNIEIFFSILPALINNSVSYFIYFSSIIFI